MGEYSSKCRLLLIEKLKGKQSKNVLSMKGVRIRASRRNINLVNVILAEALKTQHTIWLNQKGLRFTHQNVSWEFFSGETRHKRLVNRS